MATWPNTLPGIEIGSELTQQDGVVRSPTDAGPSKIRRRFTATSRYLSGTMLLTSTQRDILQTFYNENSALSFDYPDPVDQSTVSARFMTSPSYNLLLGGPSGVELYRANISLELLP